MTTTFENAKVGDRVWAYPFGWLKIGLIDSDQSEYPITLIDEDRDFKDTCTFDGKLRSTDKYQSVFWDERTWADDVPEQPVRRPEFEVDQPLIVSQNDDFRFSEKAHFSRWPEDGKPNGVLCFIGGRTSFTKAGTVFWPYYKTPEEE